MTVGVGQGLEWAAGAQLEIQGVAGRLPHYRTRCQNIYSRVLLAWQYPHCAETGRFLFHLSVINFD